MASEEMLFENADGRTDNDGRMPAYTISSPMSLWLRSAKKEKNTGVVCEIYPT